MNFRKFKLRTYTATIDEEDKIHVFRFRDFFGLLWENSRPVFAAESPEEVHRICLLAANHSGKVGNFRRSIPRVKRPKISDRQQYLLHSLPCTRRGLD